jgi:hypothetical protein
MCIWDMLTGTELQDLDWIVSQDSWVVNKLSLDCLLWLPQHIVVGLQSQHCLTVISCRGTTGLKFTLASIGPHWSNC